MMSSTDCETIIRKTGWGVYNFLIVGLCGLCSFAQACVPPLIIVSVPFMVCDLDLSFQQTTFAYASLTLGMAIGAFVVGLFIDEYGRKCVIPVTMIIIFCSSIILSFAQSIVVINLSMCALGTGLAGNNVVLRVYLIEFLPKDRRGFCMVILDLLAVIGCSCSIALAWVLMPSMAQMQNKKFRPNSWRVLTGLGSLPNLIMACAASLLPQSPRHLLHRGRNADAMTVLQQIFAINNSKHVDAYPIQMEQLENCIRTDNNDEPVESDLIKEVQKFYHKSQKRVEKLFAERRKGTTLLGVFINFLQYPGYSWFALWCAHLIHVQEYINESGFKNITCVADMQGLALEYLRDCKEIGTEQFQLLVYLSLSYVIAELLLLIGVDFLRRKTFLMISSAAGAIGCFVLLFTERTSVQIFICTVVLGTYTIARTTATIMLLEHYFTGVRGTVLGLSRLLPYLVGGFSKIYLIVHCAPSIIAMAGVLMDAKYQMDSPTNESGMELFKRVKKNIKKSIFGSTYICSDTKYIKSKYKNPIKNATPENRIRRHKC